MSRNPYRVSGLDAFWEDADHNASGEHPLERELCDHLDALARYQRLIADARDSGWDAAAEFLLRQHAREEEAVQGLTRAIRRLRDGGRER